MLPALPLAQGPAPEAPGWTVTTFIALAAALISLATLIVTTVATSRRERANWARETLAEAFFDFVDASYDAGQAGKDHFTSAGPGTDPGELEGLVEKYDEHVDQLTHMQTRIRLLAPNKTLLAAKELRWRLLDLRRSLTTDTTQDEHRRLVRAIAKAREDFVALAKEDMSLPK
jgi:hypothetical protein